MKPFRRCTLRRSLAQTQKNNVAVTHLLRRLRYHQPSCDVIQAPTNAQTRSGNGDRRPNDQPRGCQNTIDGERRSRALEAVTLKRKNLQMSHQTGWGLRALSLHTIELMN